VAAAGLGQALVVKANAPLRNLGYASILCHGDRGKEGGDEKVNELIEVIVFILEVSPDISLSFTTIIIFFFS